MNYAWFWRCFVDSDDCRDLRGEINYFLEPDLDKINCEETKDGKTWWKACSSLKDLVLWEIMWLLLSISYVMNMISHKCDEWYGSVYSHFSLSCSLYLFKNLKEQMVWTRTGYSLMYSAKSCPSLHVCLMVTFTVRWLGYKGVIKFCACARLYTSSMHVIDQVLSYIFLPLWLQSMTEALDNEVKSKVSIKVGKIT